VLVESQMMFAVLATLIEYQSSLGMFISNFVTRPVVLSVDPLVAPTPVGLLTEVIRLTTVCCPLVDKSKFSPSNRPA